MSDTSVSGLADDGGAFAEDDVPLQAPDYRHGEYGLQPLDLNKPTLRRGSSDTGHKVRYLQGVLKNEVNEDLDIDGHGYGSFGPQTERAVRNLQIRFGVKDTGVVDWDGPDGRHPGPNATWPIIDRLAAGTHSGPSQPETLKPVENHTAPAVGSHGAMAAALAAHGAGFDGDDLTTITMIAGRESRWRADAVNPNTSDRGMWQINWATIKKEPYAPLRQRLGITSDTDLLDLDINAAVAWQMYQDSIAQRRPWHPWRGSERGWNGSGPGWDGNGDHLWRTEPHRAEAKAAAQAVLRSREEPDTTTQPTENGHSTVRGTLRGTYTVNARDSDGFVAVVSRCLGITDAPWTTKRRVAEAIARHNGVALDRTWHAGDSIRIPPTVEGVRCYVVKPGDGLFAIAKGLGLGRDATDRVVAINAWQGSTPHPGDTWYGGTSS